MTDTAATALPSFQQIIEMLESADAAPPFAPPDPSTAALVERFPELAAVEEREVMIEGPHGDVPARLYRAHGDTPNAALVWAHGGGFVAGDLAMAEAHWVALMLAARGFPVLSVDYRKCLRGVRFPVPSDDVIAAWQWAVAHADELGIVPERLHLGGASAGANLTAGVTKRLRDGAGVMPASLVLAYPLVHAVLPAGSEELREVLANSEAALPFTPEMVRHIVLQFTGDEQLLDDPYAFAANGDASGHPPAFILNSEIDTLRASGEAYAERLGAAGVETRVEFEPGTQHGHLNEPYSDGGQRSIERIVGWLNR